MNINLGRGMHMYAYSFLDKNGIRIQIGDTLKIDSVGYRKRKYKVVRIDGRLPLVYVTPIASAKSEDYESIIELTDFMSQDIEII